MSVTITGHAAVFDRVDRGGDIFRRGAFRGAGAVPLLVQHRAPAAGVVTGIEEDEHGLRIVARVEDARVAALVRGGALTGLSVGYRVRASRQGARREILAAELAEVSLVAVPMQPAARVTAIDPA